MRKRYIAPGEHMYLVMPFSEVCMHMRIAGKRMNAEVRANNVQLLDENDRTYSFPITLGEAGVFSDDNGNYVYEPEEESETKCIHGTTDDELCLVCADIVSARYVVRRRHNNQNLARFDSPAVATYWIEERDSADYLGVWDDKEKRWVEDAYCETCKVPGHDVCSLTVGCPCCDETMSQD